MQNSGREVGRLRALWPNLALLVASIGVVLGCGEGIARLALSAPLPWLYPQLRYRSDPELVFTLVPNQVGFSADKPVRINSRRLRGEIVDYSRKPGRLRLLWLGDSIVFGFGVADEEVMSRRVESRLERTGVMAESINTGVPAYNTEQEVTFLAGEGIRYDPDWIILGFCWNDINDQLGAWVCPDGRLISRTADAASCEPTFMESPRGYELRNSLKRSRLVYGIMEGMRALHESLSPDDHSLFRREIMEDRDTARVRAGWKRVEDAIHRLGVLGRAMHSRVLIVALPLPSVLEKPYPRSEYPSRLQEIARHEGLSYLDLEPSFRKAYRGHDSLFIPYDGDHPNAAGHDLAAGEVAAFLLAGGAGRPELAGEAHAHP